MSCYQSCCKAIWGDVPVDDLDGTSNVGFPHLTPIREIDRIKDPNSEEVKRFTAGEDGKEGYQTNPNLAMIDGKILNASMIAFSMAIRCFGVLHFFGCLLQDFVIFPNAYYKSGYAFLKIHFFEYTEITQLSDGIFWILMLKVSIDRFKKLKELPNINNREEDDETNTSTSSNADHGTPSTTDGRTPAEVVPIVVPTIVPTTPPLLVAPSTPPEERGVGCYSRVLLILRELYLVQNFLVFLAWWIVLFPCLGAYSDWQSDFNHGFIIILWFPELMLHRMTFNWRRFTFYTIWAFAYGFINMAGSMIAGFDLYPMFLPWIGTNSYFRGSAPPNWVFSFGVLSCVQLAIMGMYGLLKLFKTAQADLFGLEKGENVLEKVDQNGKLNTDQNGKLNTDDSKYELYTQNPSWEDFLSSIPLEELLEEEPRASDAFMKAISCGDKKSGSDSDGTVSTESGKRPASDSANDELSSASSSEKKSSTGSTRGSSAQAHLQEADNGSSDPISSDSSSSSTPAGSKERSTSIAKARSNSGGEHTNGIKNSSTREAPNRVSKETVTNKRHHKRAFSSIMKQLEVEESDIDGNNSSSSDGKNSSTSGDQKAKTYSKSQEFDGSNNISNNKNGTNGKKLEEDVLKLEELKQSPQMKILPKPCISFVVIGFMLFMFLIPHLVLMNSINFGSDRNLEYIFKMKDIDAVRKRLDEINDFLNLIQNEEDRDESLIKEILGKNTNAAEVAWPGFHNSNTKEAAKADETVKSGTGKTGHATGGKANASTNKSHSVADKSHSMAVSTTVSTRDSTQEDRPKPAAKPRRSASVMSDRSQALYDTITTSRHHREPVFWLGFRL